MSESHTSESLMGETQKVRLPDLNAESESLLSAEPHLSTLALIHLAALLGAALLTILATQIVPGLAGGPLWLIIGVLAAFNAGLLVYWRKTDPAKLDPRMQALLLHVQIWLDLIGLTLLLHFAGGAENPFFPFLALPVIVAAALLSRRAAFGYAALASLLYTLLLGVELNGWIPHSPPAGLFDPLMHLQRAFLAAQLVALTTICFLIAGATSVLVSALRRRARELAASKEAAEISAAQMRELNEQLHAASMESSHQRGHLDAAYAELQRAYDRLEVRSRHMSELNEQLRAANAECKHRREELAELNTRLAEAYQRQETRTERMRDLNEQLRLANAECKSRREDLERLNTELAHANAKLIELEDVRAQFTLLVTHELRAPVAAVQSYLKLILEGYVPQPKVRETLEKAERRAMEQLALIADLLELGRIGSADARGQVQSVQVEKSLRDQADLLASGARERNITINLDIGPDLPPVLSNPDQIKSLWNNLISNAIKYNRDAGQVDVTLKQEGDRLVASVRDTGIGIPPEAMARLFSEFFRADNAKVHSRMGTGLGLSIVKEIVERSGGQITAESELDKGTTFRFWLPVMSKEPSAASAPDATDGTA
jgi:signal transduction histidine kinase